MIDYQTFCEIKRLYNEKKLSSNKIGKILGIDQKRLLFGQSVIVL